MNDYPRPTKWQRSILLYAEQTTLTDRDDPDTSPEPSSFWDHYLDCKEERLKDSGGADHFYSLTTFIREELRRGTLTQSYPRLWQVIAVRKQFLRQNKKRR